MDTALALIFWWALVTWLVVGWRYAPPVRRMWTHTAIERDVLAAAIFFIAINRIYMIALWLTVIGLPAISDVGEGLARLAGTLFEVAVGGVLAWAKGYLRRRDKWVG